MAPSLACCSPAGSRWHFASSSTGICRSLGGIFPFLLATLAVPPCLGWDLQFHRPALDWDLPQLFPATEKRRNHLCPSCHVVAGDTGVPWDLGLHMDGTCFYLWSLVPVSLAAALQPRLCRDDAEAEQPSGLWDLIQLWPWGKIQVMFCHLLYLLPLCEWEAAVWML